MGKANEGSRYLQVKVFEARHLRLTCTPGSSSPPSVSATVKQGNLKFKTEFVLPTWRGEARGWCISWDEEGDFKKAVMDKSLKIVLIEKREGHRASNIGGVAIRVDHSSIRTVPNPQATNALSGTWYVLESKSSSGSQSSLSSSSSTSLNSASGPIGDIRLQINWIGEPPLNQRASHSSLDYNAASRTSSDHADATTSNGHDTKERSSSMFQAFSHKSKKTDKKKEAESQSLHANSKSMYPTDASDTNSLHTTIATTSTTLPALSSLSLSPNGQPDQGLGHTKTTLSDTPSKLPKVSSSADSFTTTEAVPPSQPLDPSQNSSEEFLPWRKSTDTSLPTTKIASSDTDFVHEKRPTLAPATQDTSLFHLRRHSFAGQEAPSRNTPSGTSQPPPMTRTASDTALEKSTSNHGDTSKGKNANSTSTNKSTLSTFSSLIGAQALKKHMKRHKKDRSADLSGAKESDSKSQMSSPRKTVSIENFPDEALSVDELSYGRFHQQRQQRPALSFQQEIATIPISVIRPPLRESHSTLASSSGRQSLGTAEDLNPTTAQPLKNNNEAIFTALPDTLRKSLKGASIQEMVPASAFVQFTTAVTLTGRRMGVSRSDVKSINLAGIECVGSLIEWSPARMVVVVGPLNGGYEGSGDVTIVTESMGVLLSPSKFTWLRDPWHESELGRTWSRLTETERKDQMHRLVQEAHVLRGDMKKLHRQLEDAYQDKRDTHQYIEKLLFRIINHAPQLLEQDLEEE